MWSPSSSFRHVLAILLVHIMLLEFPDVAETRNLASRSLTNSTIPALFIFGDSTVDSGNNNYIKTIARSNFPPYGKDFPNHIPTGRFTNGKLLTDFLVSYAGIKDFIPPYLDPKLSLDDLKTGVCFASAGTGFDPLTAQISDGVISMENQLNYFKEYKWRMELYIGKESTRSLISKALFLISAGTNDFIVNYYGPPIRKKTYTISAYQDFVLHLSQEFVQGLLNMGVRNIGFVGIPPIGCLPAIITLNSGDVVSRRGCIEWMSTVARSYNLLLQNILWAMQNQGVNIKYLDVYKPVDDMIKNPQQFGFEKVNSGCCGSGLIETSLLCNIRSSVCSDDSKYVFWDSVHPTEAAYYIIFQTVLPILNQFLY
ncbi:hypothetical protein OROMI_022272 [Orobanche minor]